MESSKDVLNWHLPAGEYGAAVESVLVGEGDRGLAGGVAGYAAAAGVDEDDQLDIGGQPVSYFFGDFGIAVVGGDYFDGQVGRAGKVAGDRSSGGDPFAADEGDVRGADGGKGRGGGRQGGGRGLAEQVFVGVAD